MSSSRITLCRCTECIAINAAGRVVSSRTRRLHENKDIQMMEAAQEASNINDNATSSTEQLPSSTTLNHEQQPSAEEEDISLNSVQGFFDPMTFGIDTDGDSDVDDSDEEQVNSSDDELAEEDEDMLRENTEEEDANSNHHGTDAGLDDDGERRFYDNSAFPTEPAAFLMFIMVLLLYSKAYCTNDGIELIMLMLNQVLCLTNHTYRFPARVHTLENWAQLNQRVYQGIQSYVCCTVCCSMYPIELGRTTHKKCGWKDGYANASICRNDLYTEKNGIFVPTQLFHYNSIQDTLQTYLQRPHFVDQLIFRRKQYAGFCSDIQDATAFNEFKVNPTDSLPFTAESPYNILISIFLDWFQLFDNNAMDVGGIYATIQNLWPSERHLTQNTLTLGILNGPHETSYLHVHHYLGLIVKELQELKEGVMMRTCYGEDVLVKVCVNHYIGDLPAIRKMLGLSAHNADLGCSNCANPFLKATVIRHGVSKQVNVYSVTDQRQWTARTMETHIAGVQLYLSQQNITQRNEIKKQHGALYSSFLKLSYFNPISDGGIDIMHLLLNGIAKRIVHNIWLGIDSTVDQHRPSLDASELAQISTAYGKLVIPLGYENGLKRKITLGNGFSGLKSSEWLIFVLVSPLVLLRCVRGGHYKNWLKFVAITRIVCSTCITTAHIDEVRQMCIGFIEDFVAVYPDPRYMSINFHMLLHLADQNLKSFGSGPSSWNFAYEARNKSMKAINTNGKQNLESTLLKRQLMDVHLEDYFDTLSQDLIANVSAAAGVDILSSIRKKDNANANQMVDAVQEEYLASTESFDLGYFLEKRQVFGFYGYECLPPSAVKSLRFKKELPLPTDDFSMLLGYYNSAYQNVQYTLAIGSVSTPQDLLSNEYLKAHNCVRKFVSLSMFHSKYKSCQSNVKRHRGSHILAYSKSRQCLAPAQVVYFFRHLAPVLDAGYNVQMIPHTFAMVRWYKPARNPLPSFDIAADFIGMCSSSFEEPSADSIIPVLSIHSPIAIVPDYIDNMSAYVKMPEQLIF